LEGFVRGHAALLAHAAAGAAGAVDRREAGVALCQHLDVRVDHLQLALAENEIEDGEVDLVSSAIRFVLTNDLPAQFEVYCAQDFVLEEDLALARPGVSAYFVRNRRTGEHLVMKTFALARSGAIRALAEAPCAAQAQVCARHAPTVEWLAQGTAAPCV
jgi:hypothetical protein